VSENMSGCGNRHRCTMFSTSAHSRFERGSTIGESPEAGFSKYEFGPRSEIGPKRLSWSPGVKLALG
jgi:hypothetical protein